MRINFTARHYKAPDKLKEYAQDEVKKLQKLYDAIIDCDIIVDYIKEKQIAEIKINVYNNVLSVKASSEDIYKSIDQAVSKIGRQLKKYKGKLRGEKHKKVLKSSEEIPSLFEEEEE
ncbi:ribosome hibernation-promoting factor, HPF/YfiA family [candidate division KSB1 bacterium]